MAVKAQSLVDTTDIFYKHLELNEIVVTGVVGDTKLKEAPQPITTISQRVLDQVSARNIIDAVAKQPGVAQMTTGGAVSKPVIRGLGSNRVVVVSDGIRQEGQQWGDEHGVEIDAADVGSVEIVKGPASLQYGSDALAGVLVLHSHSLPQPDEIKGDVSVQYHTNNGLINYSASVAGNKKGVVFDLRYSEKYAHAYRNKLDGFVPNSQFNERAASARVGLNKSWGHSFVKMTYYNINLSIPEGERDTITGDLLSETEDLKTYRHGLPYQKVFHYKVLSDNSITLPKGYLKIVAAYQQNRRNEFEESPDTAGLRLHLHTATTDVRYVYDQNDTWKASAGLNGMFQTSINNGDEFLIPDYSFFDIGTFATASFSVKKWTLCGGLRFDFRHLIVPEMQQEEADFKSFKRDFVGVTGSLGAVFNANDNFGLKLNIARGFRMPSVNELALNGHHEGTLRYEIGNSDLKPEYSLQADLGIDYKNKYFSMQLTPFVSYVSNYIFASRLDTIIEDDLMTFQFQQGNALLTGFEASVDIHPIHQLHIGSAFSYVYSLQLHSTEETKYLPLTPAPCWSSDVKWEITHDARIFNNAYAAVGVDWYLKQNHYYKAYDTETATKGYALLNVSIGTDVFIKDRKAFEIHLIADNLLNTVYQSHLSRLKYADVNVVTRRRGVFDMGRNFVFKIKVPIG